MERIGAIIYFLLCLGTSMIGFEIHHSAFYSVLDFFLMPFAWIWWMFGHDVNMTIIKHTFEFFLK